MKTKKCAFHPQQNLVNFCRNPECMLPMCPSCIKVHSAEHARKGTHGFYDCISDINVQVQKTLQNTLNSLVSNGNQIKQVFKQKKSEKQLLISKLKSIRVHILGSINSFIDNIEQDIISQFDSIQSLTQESISQIQNRIQILSQEAAQQINNLNSQNSMKAIINHISSNMPSYYSFKINQIINKIGQTKQFKVVLGKQLSNKQVAESLKYISQYYQTNIIQPIKRASIRKTNLDYSNASKLSKVSTSFGSNKKVA